MEPVLTTKNGRIFEIWELLERVCENPGGGHGPPLPLLADAHGPNDELIFNCPPAEGTLFIPCCDNITYETVFMTCKCSFLSIMLIVAIIIAK